MVANISTFELEDMLQSVFPLGTTVVSGGEDVHRPVRWVLTIHPEAPLPYLEGGELILLLPGKGDLTALINTCAEVGVTAIACPPPISPITLAGSTRLPNKRDATSATTTARSPAEPSLVIVADVPTT